MKPFLHLTTAVLLAMASTGCNTVHGMGQDLQTAGKKIQDVVKKK